MVPVVGTPGLPLTVVTVPGVRAPSPQSIVAVNASTVPATGSAKPGSENSAGPRVIGVPGTPPVSGGGVRTGETCRTWTVRLAPRTSPLAVLAVTLTVTKPGAEKACSADRAGPGNGST